MNPRDRRALGYGFVVVLACWSGLRGVPVLLDWHRAQEEITEVLRARLDHAHQTLDALPRVEDSVEVAERFIGELRDRLLVGPDPETAAFDLMSRVTLRLSPVPSMFIDQVQPHADTLRVGALQRVRVEARLQTDVLGLLDALEVLEFDPSMAIHSLAVASEDSAPDETRAEVLTVRVGIAGWFRARPPDSAEDGR